MEQDQMIFVIELITALIGIAGALISFKKGNFVVIVEKSVMPPEKQNEKTPERTKLSRKPSSSGSIDSEYFFVITFVLLILSVWFNLKYHVILELILVITTLTAAIFGVLYNNKVNVPIKETIINPFFFLQPFLFSLSQQFFSNSFDYEGTKAIFANATKISDYFNALIANLFIRPVPIFAAYQLSEVLFITLFSAGLLLMSLHMLDKLLNKHAGFVNRLSARLYNPIMLFLPSLWSIFNVYFAFYCKNALT